MDAGTPPPRTPRPCNQHTRRRNQKTQLNPAYRLGLPAPSSNRTQTPRLNGTSRYPIADPTTDTSKSNNLVNETGMGGSDLGWWVVGCGLWVAVGCLLSAVGCLLLAVCCWLFAGSSLKVAD